MNKSLTLTKSLFIYLLSGLRYILDTLRNARTQNWQQNEEDEDDVQKGQIRIG